MTVDVLVERIDGGRYRAKTGEPFAMSAEGATDQEAVSRVQTALAQRLRDGATLVRVAVGTAGPTVPLPDDELTREWVEELKRIRVERNVFDAPEVAAT